MDLARFAALDDEADARAGSFADQVVMHTGAGEQRGNRGVLRVHVAVRQDENGVSVGRAGAGELAELLQRTFEPGGALTFPQAQNIPARVMCGRYTYYDRERDIPRSLSQSLSSSLNS